MASVVQNMLIGNQTGASKGLQALGVPPVGNAGGSNMPGPSKINDIASGVIDPNSPLTGGGAIPVGSAGSGTLLPGQQPQFGAAPTVGALNPGVAGPLNHQLTDVYGKGTGGAISSLISNLGSNDSSYLQNYDKAMSQENAKGLATLDTTLGNSGVSADSSTAAIADADFESGVVAQEGLQESQLQQVDQQDLIGLLTSTEGASNQQASTSVWGDIGGVLGAVGQDAAKILA